MDSKISLQATGWVERRVAVESAPPRAWRFSLLWVAGTFAAVAAIIYLIAF